MVEVLLDDLLGDLRCIGQNIGVSELSDRGKQSLKELLCNLKLELYLLKELKK